MASWLTAVSSGESHQFQNLRVLKEVTLARENGEINHYVNCWLIRHIDLLFCLCISLRLSLSLFPSSFFFFLFVLALLSLIHNFFQASEFYYSQKSISNYNASNSMIVFQDSYSYNLWLSFLCWRMTKDILFGHGIYVVDFRIVCNFAFCELH